MHRKAVLTLGFIVLLTFGNSVLNDFVGDDYVVILDNSFYTSWSNFPRLFTPAYITQSDDVFNKTEYFHTGSIAYRPVLSASFFVDYWVWQRNPRGYHFHNVLLHLANVLLVYFMVFSILQSESLSLWSAILFAVHPLQTEAVCAIGYRADTLACFFLLLAFLGYIKATGKRGVMPGVLLACSHAAFALAVFAKESAVVFVALLMAFDRLIRGERKRDILRRVCGRYAGFILISSGYLYVYLYVFRNSTLDNARLLGGAFVTHVVTMVQIFARYLIALILPFSVKTLPPLYAPQIENYAGHGTWFSLLACGLFVFILWMACRRQKAAAFFLLWFLISFMPVSNIIPLVNPMAYRFMYLPSVGFLVALAVGLYKAGASWDHLFQGVRLGKIMRWGWVMLCIVMTFSLNAAWKDNFVIASFMVRDFPGHPQGYLHLGMEYFRKGDMRQAEAAVRKGLEKGLEDPWAYYFMGIYYFHDFERARPYYEKSIRLFPSYALSYIGLGRIYVLEGSYAQAIPYLQRAIELAPSYAGYGYLMQGYLRLGHLEEAIKVLEEAKKLLTRKEYIDSLKKLIAEHGSLEKPVDIGI
jgi:pentatricopeptide repeat protein